MPLPMYAALLSPPVLSSSHPAEVAEPQRPYHLLTERHIQAMWLEQKYFHHLQTDDGQEIHVISPGIWNNGPGPDFLKAHLKIGEREIRGDVELHLSDDGWYQHKHHMDCNYNNVVLHISYWSPTHERPLLSAGGNKIPKTYLKKKLTISESRILRLIDLDLYPYIQFTGSGTCAGSLFQALPEKKIALFFRSAAEWRLRLKWDALTARSETLADAAITGLSLTLGYKHNAEAFAQLFILMTSQNLESEKQRLACALGHCGFFEAKYQMKWNNSPYFCELQSIYTALEMPVPTARLTIKQNQIRPPSHPVRRLAVLAKLASDKDLRFLLRRLLQLWNETWKDLKEKKSLAHFRRQLNGLLPDYEDAYWQHHYAFETTPQNKPIALIGDDLKQEMAVNILLPLLYGHIEEDPQQLAAFMHLYASFPSPKTHKTKYLAHRFFGASLASKVLKNTDIQQGAYQLHRDFCIHFEASCQGCPFVARYKATFDCLHSQPCWEKATTSSEANFTVHC